MRRVGVEQGDLDLAPVAGVDGAGGVHDRHAVPGGEPRPGMDEGGVPVRQRNAHSGRHGDPPERWQLDVDGRHQVRTCVPRHRWVLVEHDEQHLHLVPHAVVHDATLAALPGPDGPVPTCHAGLVSAPSYRERLWPGPLGWSFVLGFAGFAFIALLPVHPTAAGTAATPAAVPAAVGCTGSRAMTRSPRSRARTTTRG